MSTESDQPTNAVAPAEVESAFRELFAVRFSQVQVDDWISALQAPHFAVAEEQRLFSDLVGKADNIYTKAAVKVPATIDYVR